jgi:tripartite-type tricarboxylate transporter receptor subunit TctC
MSHPCADATIRQDQANTKEDNTMLTRRLICALAAPLAAAAISPFAALSAQAQAFPNRAITMVVPFAAGGPSDAIARLVGEHMGRTLGQQVVIENVAGAGGTAGAARVAAAQADGHTILIHHVALKAAPALYNNLRYDTSAAFEMVGAVNTGPMVLVGKRQLAPNDAREFFAWAKAQGDKVTVAHAGVGSNSHICTILMGQALGIKPTMVAYRGTGPAMTDVVAGQVDVLCDQSTTAVPQIQGNAVKAFAVTSPQRLNVLPNVPTAIEAGMPVDLTIWHGMYAPRGTPSEALDRLNGALQAALRDATIVERFAAVGTTPFPEAQRTRAAHRTMFDNEIARLSRALREAGVAASAAN